MNAIEALYSQINDDYNLLPLYLHPMLDLPSSMADNDLFACLDHYATLGVSPTANASEIKKAFFEVRFSSSLLLRSPLSCSFSLRIFLLFAILPLTSHLWLILDRKMRILESEESSS